MREPPARGFSQGLDDARVGRRLDESARLEDRRGRSTAARRRLDGDPLDLWSRTSLAYNRVVASVLYGRDAPLQELRAALDTALVGRGTLAVVSGEAGIGKSAIVAEIAREAEARRATVTWGRAWEFADAPPYFPVWACLGSLGVVIDRVIPSRAPVDAAVGQDAFRLWEDVVSSIARASSTSPVVWVLEDLHAADLLTLDLLTFLAHPLRAMPAMVIVTARDQDPRLTDRAAQRLTRMARDGVDVRLTALGDHDVAALASSAAGRQIGEDMVRRLTELTGGNPLFVVECARALGTPWGQLGSLPPTVRQFVLDRLALLPDATRDALASGSVLGREFSAASVARMHGLLPAQVIEALLHALRSGLVAEAAPGQFAFSHALVRDAVYAALDPMKRAEIHRCAARALAAEGIGTVELLVERARHALAGLPGGDGTEVLALADRAATLLEREGAFDRAFELNVRVEDARRGGLLPAASAEEALRFAGVARAAGRLDVTSQLCEAILAASRLAGDGELFSRAALLHAADVQPGIVDTATAALLEEARAMLGERLPALSARLLARHATSLQPAMDQEVPMSMSRQAIGDARDSGDPTALVYVLDQARWGLYAAPLAERLAVGSELLERARAVADHRMALAAHEALALLHVEAGDFLAFDGDVDAMLRLADDIGHPRYRWRALLLASTRSLTRGELDASDSFVTEVVKHGALIDDPLFPIALALHDFTRKRAARRDDEVRTGHAAVAQMMSGFAHARMQIAMLAAACAARRSDLETARKELARVGRPPDFLLLDPSLAACVAEAYACGGSADDRRWIRDVLAGREMRDIPADPVSFMYEGTVVRLLGLLDASLGKLDLARRELEEAHALATERGHRVWVAQTAYELAAVLRASGEEWQVALEQSLGLACDLGMIGLEKDARARLSEWSGVRDAPETPAEPSRVVRIERLGNEWAVRRGDRMVSVKDSRGMQLLARLVERPDQEIHVLALASDEATSMPESTAGELIDEHARAAYRGRLMELDQELAAAERDADLGRLTRLRGEREALIAELARAVGLHGRARPAGSATERARVNVQRRLRDAMVRIGESDEELGRYFRRAIRTGTFCSFRP